MLSLKHIYKKYGDNEVLKDINIDFREHELVAILGESGSGKSTMLNIIGGLDKYDAGDLLIDGISTKNYKNKDWDLYREQRMGFVFQSYNLIEHLNVVDNVNFALAHRSEKDQENEVIPLLKKLGLLSKLKTNVRNLSGGEKQRVAIARALIKKPEVLLCDEPTGALDSNNSLEIMKLLKEIAKKKLVIVVTHSEELAKKYADRIITIKDGKIIKDNNIYHISKQIKVIKKNKYKKLNIIKSLKLSFNNLRYRKGRTMLVSFAGSIGIIGISLIISLSSGVKKYVKSIEDTTIGNYPIKINKTSFDYSDIDLKNDSNIKCSKNKICSRDDISNSDEIVDAIALKENNLKDFKKYLDNNKRINNLGYINYLYDMDLYIYSKDGNQVSPDSLSINNSNFLMEEKNTFQVLPDNKDVLSNKYELVAGELPNNYNELVLVISNNNELKMSTLYKLDIESKEEYEKFYNDAKENKKVSIEEKNYNYKDLLNIEYKLVLNTSLYLKSSGKWNKNNDLKALIKNGEDLKIVGVLKDKEGSGNYIGYTKALLNYVVGGNRSSNIYKEQSNNREYNVLTSNKINDEVEYNEVMKKLGIIDLDNPSSIEIYTSKSKNKKEIKRIINHYNSDNKNKKIYYVDMMSVLLDTLSSMVNIISLVLLSLVAVSLIVSSIMIAIITYISVVERNKEIGILRALGGSSRDVKNVFLAETMIEGFLAGIIGVLLSIILLYPMNYLIFKISNIEKIANLPIGGALVLIMFSIILSMLSGFIPASIAAKKEIVLSLRND